MSEKDNNIFICLSKYPRSEKDPDENFFTEAFALVLRKEELAPYLLKGLSEKHEKLTKVAELISEGSKSEIITQSKRPTINRSGFTPDIEIKNGQLLLLIENKLDSPLDELQLRNYITEIEGKEKEFCLYITKNFEEKLYEVNDSNFEHVGWYEIYEVIERYYNNTEKPKLVKEFLEFMEDKDMKPMELKPEGDYADAWTRCVELIKFHDQIKEDIKKKLEDSFRDLVNQNEEATTPSEDFLANRKWFGDYLKLEKNDNLGLGLSFWNLDEKEIEYEKNIEKLKPGLCLWFGIYAKKNKYPGVSDELIKWAKSNKKISWHESGGWISCGIFKPIEEIQNKKGSEQVKTVYSFVGEGIDQIKRPTLLKELRSGMKNSAQ